MYINTVRETINT